MHSRVQQHQQRTLPVRGARALGSHMHATFATTRVQNVYCNGTFIDQSAATIADWKSYAYNNVEACPQQ